MGATLVLWLAGEAGLPLRSLLGLQVGGYLLLWFGLAGVLSMALLWQRRGHFNPVRQPVACQIPWIVAAELQGFSESPVSTPQLNFPPVPGEQDGQSRSPAARPDDLNRLVGH